MLLLLLLLFAAHANLPLRAIPLKRAASVYLAHFLARRSQLRRIGFSFGSHFRVERQKCRPDLIGCRLDTKAKRANQSDRLLSAGKHLSGALSSWKLHRQMSANNKCLYSIVCAASHNCTLKMTPLAPIDANTQIVRQAAASRKSVCAYTHTHTLTQNSHNRFPNRLLLFQSGFEFKFNVAVVPTSFQLSCQRYSLSV